MNPLDILQRTPKTNCGECGHATCLAFAAAVARAGEEVTLCPYINLEGLELVSSVGKKDMDELAEQVNQQQNLALVKYLQSKISSFDFGAIAGSLGADWSAEQPDFLSFRYLGRELKLGKSNVLLDNDTVVDPRDQILLYNYIHCGGGRKPDGNWVGMESLPNSISKVKTLATYCEEKIAKSFVGKPLSMLLEISQKLDGITGPGDLSESATAAFVIPVLPMIPQFLLFWDEEPDDGFEAKAKVLFDHHVLDFLDIESLLFSAERLAERIVDLLDKQ
jgi:hypothetical protein